MIFSRQNDKRSHVCSVLLLVNVILGLEYKAPYYIVEVNTVSIQNSFFYKF